MGASVKCAAVAVVVWAALLPGPAVCSGWVQWPGNGHWYKAVAHSGINWADAEAAAESVGGHLVTLTSAEENDFVFSLIDSPEYWRVDAYNSNIGPWTGGLQPAGSPEPGGNWQWVTGEPFSFTAWANNQPDNFGSGDENRIDYFYNPAPTRKALWNDVGGGATCKGYVIEIDLSTWPGWQQWSGNGHWYKAVLTPDGITWDDAKAEAEAEGGHLATLSSAPENEFIFDLIDAAPFWYTDQYNSSHGPWIGGFQPPGSPEPDGNWQWVTGEPFSFTAWYSGQPDNFGGAECRLNYYAKPGPNRSSGWNDLPAAAKVRGFIIERDSAQSDSPPGFFNPGWNWFSLPLIPDDPSVTAIFGANNLANRLYRWDPVQKTVQLYPDDFTELTVDETYMALLNTTFDLTLSGTQTPPGYVVPIVSAGWAWIGYPKAGPTFLQDAALHNLALGETRTALQDRAAADPWINWNWIFWNSTLDTAQILAFSGADDDMLRPWYGYLVWSNTENLEVIYADP
jgi:hypothetical protein